MNFSLGIMALCFITSTLAKSNTTTSRIWTGLTMNSPVNETFNSITGTFSVPLARAPKGATPGNYSANVWAGIDGWTNQVILQAGFLFDVVVQSDGSQKNYYNAWYEWYPLSAVDIPLSELSMMPGDEIKVDISISSFSTGAVVLTNLHTSQVWSKTVTSPDNSSNLGGTSAEWIVEDFGIRVPGEPDGTEIAPLGNFGTVNMTNCRASTQKSDIKLTDASMLLINLIDKSGHLMSNTTVLSDTAAQVTYTGE
jgi:hypothetical protein